MPKPAEDEEERERGGVDEDEGFELSDELVSSLRQLSSDATSLG